MNRSRKGAARLLGASLLLSFPGLPMMHGLLDLVGKARQVKSQPIEQFSLRRIGRKVADQPAFNGSVRSFSKRVW